MATKIRLRRIGATNKPFYRLVVADSRFATTGRFLEILGWYDPKQAEKNFSVNLDRVNYWLGTGAQMSNTAKSLIKKAQAGEGVAPGAASERKQVDTQALLDEVPETVAPPAAPPPEKVPEEPAESADGASGADAETGAGEEEQQEPEKQES